MHMLFCLKILLVAVLVLQYCPSGIQGNKTPGKKRKRRCRKVCEDEFESLKERVRELEDKLSRLSTSRYHVDYVQGPKGEKGDSGPRGPSGPRGDRGHRGLLGLPGRDGTYGKLPSCLPREYLSSNGKKLVCLPFEKGTLPVKPVGPTDRPKATDNNKAVSTLQPEIGEGNGQDTIRLPNPTISAGLAGKIDRFSTENFIQDFYADTWDLHSFVWDQNTYLGISQLSTQSFILKKWVQNEFIEKAILTVPNARKWTSFEWQSEMYIVIACNTRTTASSEDQSAYSYIYKMKYDEIVLFQKLETRTAFGVDTIEIGNDLFLMFAYLYGDRRGANSDVFKWTAGEFKKHHTIPVIGTDVDAFTVEGKHFAAVVGTTSRDPYVYLLQYNGSQFVPAFNIPMDSRPYGLTFVRTRNAYFLAVAFYDLPQSLILKWNGVAFENHQSVACSKARDFATTTIVRSGKEITYLALVNYDGNPIIYIYEEKPKTFTKLQQTNSKWTRDMEFLRVPNSPHINLAVASTRKITIYKGSTT